MWYFWYKIRSWVFMRNTRVYVRLRIAYIQILLGKLAWFTMWSQALISIHTVNPDGPWCVDVLYENEYICSNFTHMLFPRIYQKKHISILTACFIFLSYIGIHSSLGSIGSNDAQNCGLDWKLTRLWEIY